MPSLHKRFSLAFAGLLLSLAGAMAGTANAQSYPSKPVFIKIAFPAGGVADAGFRQAQPGLQAALGQPLLLENLPGAGGSIGAMNVVNAAADGYTLLGTTGTDLILAPMSVASAKYRPGGFKLIGVLAVTDFVLVSSPRHNFGSIDDFIEQTRKPGAKELSIAHWGHGSTPHIVGADFQARTGVKLLEVPYKGVAPIIPDIIGNQVDLSFLPLGGPVLGLIRTGKVKAIGITGNARNPGLPEVPTLNEGRILKDFDYTIWTGLFAIDRTPDAVLLKLNRDLAEWTRTPANQAFTREQAQRTVDAMNLQQAEAFFKAEQDKLVRVARAVKLEPQ